MDNIMWVDVAVFAGIVCLPLVAISVPIGIYLKSVWNLRKHEIMASFADDAVCYYFKTFFFHEYTSLAGAGVCTFNGKPPPGGDASVV